MIFPFFGGHPDSWWSNPQDFWLTSGPSDPSILTWHLTVETQRNSHEFIYVLQKSLHFPMILLFFTPKNSKKRIRWCSQLFYDLFLKKKGPKCIVRAHPLASSTLASARPSRPLNSSSREMTTWPNAKTMGWAHCEILQKTLVNIP